MLNKDDYVTFDHCVNLRYAKSENEYDVENKSDRSAWIEVLVSVYVTLKPGVLLAFKQCTASVCLLLQRFSARTPIVQLRQEERLPHFSTDREFIAMELTSMFAGWTRKVSYRSQCVR